MEIFLQQQVTGQPLGLDEPATNNCNTWVLTMLTAMGVAGIELPPGAVPSDLGACAEIQHATGKKTLVLLELYYGIPQLSELPCTIRLLKRKEDTEGDNPNWISSSFGARSDGRPGRPTLASVCNHR